MISPLGFGEIHVPRTAGTSRHQALCRAGVSPYYGGWHWTARRYMREFGADIFERIYGYSVRRSPAEVVVSTYYYRRDKLEHPNAVAIPEDMRPNLGFQEWWEECCGDPDSDSEPWAQGQEILSHIPYWKGDDGELYSKLEIWPFENLATLWHTLHSRYGVPETVLDHVNSSTGKKSKEDGWVEEHFTRKGAEILWQRFQADYETLGIPERDRRIFKLTGLLGQ